MTTFDAPLPHADPASPRHPAGLSIREWPLEDRPREKLQRHGAGRLTDTELLALMINTGSNGRSAMDLARDLLLEYRTLNGISRRPLAEVRRRPGLGISRAARLMAAFEIGRRAAAEVDRADAPVAGPEDVAQRYIPRLRDLPTERFLAVLLNNAGCILRDVVVSEGTVNASIVHPREVFHAAVTERATAVIIVHNHPSGVRQASREDRAVTQQLVEAGRILDIPVRDHIIVCGNGYISFAENGWL
jgi:DNA repair protein RadC